MEINNLERNWAILQKELDGKPLFIRFRQDLRNAVNRPNYNFQIGVATPLLQPTQDGLTTDQETVQLNLIEDELEDIFNKVGEVIHVMTLTCNGMREFVFYSDKEKTEEFQRGAEEVQQKVGDGHELQFMIQPDNEWRTFVTYTNPDSSIKERQ